MYGIWIQVHSAPAYSTSRTCIRLHILHLHPAYEFRCWMKILMYIKSEYHLNSASSTWIQHLDSAPASSSGQDVSAPTQKIINRATKYFKVIFTVLIISWTRLLNLQFNCRHYFAYNLQSSNEVNYICLWGVHFRRP